MAELFFKIMADLGTLIPIVKGVFEFSQSQVLKDVKDWESNLENLNKSVSFIKNMLLDADRKPELSHEERAWVEYLKEVMYEADDLSDEIITKAKLKKPDDDDRFLDKVSRFFSCMNCILVSYNTSQEVKSIQLKLDAIAKDHDRYNFKVDQETNLENEEDTSSFLNETDENESIIGREDDVKVVVDMLFDPNVDENVGFVVVVGIGGLGKTTLAQLVYNNDRVGTMFEKKLWVCVSDQDGKGLNVKTILKNIIESSTTEAPSDVSTMQSVQTILQKELKNKTYLLILDNVWTEDSNEWNKLRKYLTIGGRGSRVVITTRSEKTAEVVLGKPTHPKIYMLKSLSPNDSWRLFMLMAFERESDQANGADPELIELGKKIVKKCSNVPLAIKVVGRLLRGQTHKWESFEMNTLPQIGITKNPIMSILKLSYDNLEPSVKNCFKYCALFPKDFQINKRNLIRLWYAQGYTADSEGSFIILLKRCFFQQVRENVFGDVISVKMHDLMHDLAQEVVGNEIIATNNLPNILSRKIRHLFIDGGEWTESSFHERNIHTCDTNTTIHLDIVKTLVDNWRWVRSLCLYGLDFENLSESIGELLHLRYLDLSQNKKLKTLPNSIAKLYTLQCLVMEGCHGFNQWPKDFCKLVNLRLLDIRDCRELTCMPSSIDQLINLCDLTNFKVGGVSSIEEQSGGQLKYLKSLVNLRGEIWITILGNLVSENGNVCEDSYLKHMQNLKMITIWIPVKACVTNQEVVIAKLQPCQYLKQFKLYAYNGSEIPRWGRAHDDWAIILPNLVRIELAWCKLLYGIPLLSSLKHLKFLSLLGLHNLEYVEVSGNSGSKDMPFFPSLESLTIVGMKRLVGWRGGVRKSHWLPPFPRLSTLKISLCPKLTSFPPCPSLESLLVNYSENLLGISAGDGHGNLDIRNCPSLKSLQYTRLCALTSGLGMLEHLTALESLSLGDTHAEVDFDDMPWGFLRQKLRYLELKYFCTLQILPTEMMYLTSLENLSISCCYSLKELPEWISFLSSLQSLEFDKCPNLKSLGTIQNITSLQKLNIKDCPRLVKECEEPSGKEWPKIRHIPHISITNE